MVANPSTTIGLGTVLKLYLLLTHLSSQQPYEVDSIMIIPILQLRKVTQGRVGLNPECALKTSHYSDKSSSHFCPYQLLPLLKTSYITSFSHVFPEIGNANNLICVSFFFHLNVHARQTVLHLPFSHL